MATKNNNTGDPVKDSPAIKKLKAQLKEIPDDGNPSNKVDREFLLKTIEEVKAKEAKVQAKAESDAKAEGYSSVADKKKKEEEKLNKEKAEKKKKNEEEAKAKEKEKIAKNKENFDALQKNNPNGKLSNDGKTYELDGNKFNDDGTLVAKNGSKGSYKDGGKEVMIGKPGSSTGFNQAYGDYATQNLDQANKEYKTRRAQEIKDKKVKGTIYEGVEDAADKTGLFAKNPTNLPSSNISPGNTNPDYVPPSGSNYNRADYVNPLEIGASNSVDADVNELNQMNSNQGGGSGGSGSPYGSSYSSSSSSSGGGSGSSPNSGNVININDLTDKSQENQTGTLDGGESIEDIQRRIADNKSLLDEAKNRAKFVHEYAPDSESSTDLAGYIADAGRGIMGSIGARTEIPVYERGEMFQTSMDELTNRRDIGLSAAEKDFARQMAERGYGYDVKNIGKFAGGSAGVALGNLGRATSQLQDQYGQIAVRDEAVRRQNRADFNRGALSDEQVNRQIFTDDLNQKMMTKQAGAALVQDSIKNIKDRAQYEKEYGKGSQMYEYMKTLDYDKKKSIFDQDQANEDRMAEVDKQTKRAIEDDEKLLQDKGQLTQGTRLGGEPEVIPTVSELQDLRAKGEIDEYTYQNKLQQQPDDAVMPDDYVYPSAANENPKDVETIRRTTETLGGGTGEGLVGVNAKPKSALVDKVTNEETPVVEETATAEEVPLTEKELNEKESDLRFTELMEKEKREQKEWEDATPEEKKVMEKDWEEKEKLMQHIPGLVKRNIQDYPGLEEAIKTDKYKAYEIMIEGLEKNVIDDPDSVLGKESQKRIDHYKEVLKNKPVEETTDEGKKEWEIRGYENEEAYLKDRNEAMDKNIKSWNDITLQRPNESDEDYAVRNAKEKARQEGFDNSKARMYDVENSSLGETTRQNIGNALSSDFNTFQSVLEDEIGRVDENGKVIATPHSKEEMDAYDADGDVDGAGEMSGGYGPKQGIKKLFPEMKDEALFDSPQGEMLRMFNVNAGWNPKVVAAISQGLIDPKDRGAYHSGKKNINDVKGIDLNKVDPETLLYEMADVYKNTYGFGEDSKSGKLPKQYNAYAERIVSLAKRHGLNVPKGLMEK